MIYTIGHSTRSLEAFLALLDAQRITGLVDVRTVPRSRRYPHFAANALSAALARAGMAYWHAPGLGGLRHPRRGSTNTAWRNESFRGYADYMETPAFAEALDELMIWSSAGVPPERDRSENVLVGADGRIPETRAPRLVLMCAEAVWWRCHRQLIADALVARGIDVRHILSAAPPDSHRLTAFARVTEAGVRYPGVG
jgi:uncharacterized protein (DUF488 family)